MAENVNASDRFGFIMPSAERQSLFTHKGMPLKKPCASGYWIAQRFASPTGTEGTE
jgi:hypothetical protein